MRASAGSCCAMTRVRPLSSFREASLGFARRAPAADRPGVGTAGRYGGLLAREGLREPGVHVAVCRSHTRPRPALVQHGHMRKSGEAGGTSAAAEGAPTGDVPWPQRRLSVLRKATPERLSALSDGVFAVLITVLVLELRPPAQPTCSRLVNGCCPQPGRTERSIPLIEIA